MSQDSKETLKYRVLSALSGRTGRSRAVDMGELYESVFGETYASHKINGTRKLRTLITELRREGVPICSVSTASGGGYYLASVGSELDDYCKRVRQRALKLLKMESNLRKISMPKLLHQIQLNLDTEAPHAKDQ
jgi:hypothetical protein